MTKLLTSEVLQMSFHLTCNVQNVGKRAIPEKTIKVLIESGIDTTFALKNV